MHESPSHWPTLMSVFDGESRQRVIVALRTLGPSTQPQIAGAAGIARSTAGRQLDALEELGVVSADLPRSVRSGGRVAHYQLSLSAYAAAIECWNRVMTVDGTET